MADPEPSHRRAGTATSVRWVHDAQQSEPDVHLGSTLAAFFTMIRGSVQLLGRTGSLRPMVEALEARTITIGGYPYDGLTVQSAEAAMLPQTTVKVEGRNAEVLMRLMGMLEDHDDVQNVWANFDMDDDLLEQLTS